MRAGRREGWCAMLATLALASAAPQDLRSSLTQRLRNRVDQTKELIVSGLILPKSVLDSVAAIGKEVVTKQSLGGYPIFKGPEPMPTFLVVGGGDQNKRTREDPYQDISARAKGAAAASGVVAGAAGALATCAALLKALAIPDALRTAQHGSNSVPGDNVFLLGAIKMLLGV